jgi:hypothetical protein
MSRELFSTDLGFRRWLILGFGAPRSGKFRQPDAEGTGDNDGKYARDSTEVMAGNDDLGTCAQPGDMSQAE